jgi:hypothetical protein
MMKTRPESAHQQLRNARAERWLPRAIGRLRPQTLTELRDVYGIGDKKLADLGERILAVVWGRELRPSVTP